MGKKNEHVRACLHAEFEDFAPFYVKEGKLWVPNQRSGIWTLNFLTPAMAWKAVNFTIRSLGASGKVAPYAMAALDP